MIAPGRIRRALAAAALGGFGVAGVALSNEALAQRFDPRTGTEVVTAASASPGHGARGDEGRAQFARDGLPRAPLGLSFTHRAGSRIGFAPVADASGSLVIASPDGLLLRIDPSGTPTSTALAGTPATSPLVLADGSIAVVLETEELVVVRQGKVESRTRLGTPVITGEALALLPDGTLGIATAGGPVRIDGKGGFRAVAPWPERARIAGQGGSWVRVGQRMYFASLSGDIVEWRLGEETTLAASLRGPLEGVAASSDRTLVALSNGTAIVSVDVGTGSSKTLAASSDGRFLASVAAAPDGTVYATWLGNGASYVVGFDLNGKEVYRVKVGAVATGADGGTTTSTTRGMPLAVARDGTVVTLTFDGSVVALGEGGRTRYVAGSGGCPSSAMSGSPREGAGNAWFVPTATTLYLACRHGGTSGFTGAVR